MVNVRLLCSALQGDLLLGCACGKFKGTVICQDEQDKGLKFVNSLTEL